MSTIANKVIRLKQCFRYNRPKMASVMNSQSNHKPAVKTAPVIQQQAAKIRRQQRRLATRPAKVVVPPRDVPFVPELATSRCVPPTTIPRLAIAMVTTDRPTSTIEASIASVRRAGFKEHIHIYSQAKHADYALLKASDRNITIYHTDTVGGTANWKAAAARLSTTDADWIMVLEDDIAWCRNGAKIMYHTINQIDSGSDGIKRHRVGMLSAYTSPAMVFNPTISGGWTEARFYGATKGLWGALALCMPRSVLLELMKLPKYINHNAPTAIDYMLGDALRQHMEPPLEVKVHVPSIVEHTGEQSTIFSAAALSSPGLKALRHGYQFNDKYSEVSNANVHTGSSHNTQSTAQGGQAASHSTGA